MSDDEIKPREAARRAKRRAEGCAAADVAWCLYCSMPIALSHEHDHFPIPHRLGGTEVHCVCVNCHDLKDRGGVLHLPESVLDDALRAYHGRCGPVEQLVVEGLLRALRDGYTLYWPISMAEWLERFPNWRTAPGIERIALAIAATVCFDRYEP